MHKMAVQVVVQAFIGRAAARKDVDMSRRWGVILYNGEEIWDFFVSIASFVFFGGMAGWVQFPGGSIWYAFRVQNIIRQSSAFIHNMCLKFTVLKSW